MNILNYKTCEISHVVTVSNLKSVDVMTVSSSGLVYVAEGDSGPILAFELTTGQIMRQIACGKRVKDTFILQTTPDDKYDRFRLLDIYTNQNDHYSLVLFPGIW